MFKGFKLFEWFNGWFSGGAAEYWFCHPDEGGNSDTVLELTIGDVRFETTDL